MSFVTEKTVQKLKLPRKNASIPLIGIGGLESGRTRGVVEINLCALHNRIASCTLPVYILPRLTRQIPTFTINSSIKNSILDLHLADPQFDQPGSIDMIIGSDSYCKILLPEMISATSSTPLAQLTIFGWVLSGPISSENRSSESTIFHCSRDKELEDLLIRFWKQEEVSISNDAMVY